jgi:hypothetical protein
MQDQTRLPDPKLRRLVYDFDALADVLHTLLDKDCLTETRTAFAPHEMEFTTEWQMAATAEEVPSR